MDIRSLSEAYLKNMMLISGHRPQRETQQFSRGELLILQYLAHQGDASPNCFVRVSGTSSAHVAQALRNLEGKGEVCRQPDPDDGRKTLVSLTEKGRLRAEASNRHVLEHLDGLMRDLGEADAAELVRITTRIAQLIRKKHETEANQLTSKEGNK